MREKRISVEKRNVALRIETYNRLEKYKVELVKERNDPRVTFDDVVNNLLDERTKRKERK